MSTITRLTDSVVDPPYANPSSTVNWDGRPAARSSPSKVRVADGVTFALATVGALALKIAAMQNTEMHASTAALRRGKRVWAPALRRPRQADRDNFVGILPPSSCA